MLNIIPPAVACTWVAWLAASYRLYVSKQEFIALGLAVWLIYTLDGLFDSRSRRRDDPLTPRREFHARHAGWLWFAAFLGFGFLLSHVLTSIGSGLFLSGLILCPVVALYLTYAQVLRNAEGTRVPKEVYAGIIFAAGVGLVIMEAHGRGAVGPVSIEMAAAAFERSIFAGLLWLGWSMLFVPYSIFSDSSVVLFALLCVANCLLTATHESRGIGDVSSAKRVAPYLIPVAPILTAALAFGCALGFFLTEAPEWKPLHAGISLSATLLYGAHLLARRNLVKPATATFLFDLALLSPLLLFPWNPPV